MFDAQFCDPGVLPGVDERIFIHTFIPTRTESSPECTERVEACIVRPTASFGFSKGKKAITVAVPSGEEGRIDLFASHP